MKTTIIHVNTYTKLGVVNLDKITNWALVQGSSNWVRVTFIDGNYPSQGSNFTFAFNSRNIYDLTKFNFELLDGKQQAIKFDDSEQKVPQLNFRIDILG